jgi:Flp pilus assembly protein TadB
MSVLVGDRERDRAANELARHYREGRLTADELAQRLETALRARNGAQLRSALKELPAAWSRTDVLRTARNAAILAGTLVVWLLWNAAVLIAFVAWLAAYGPSLGALLAFPVVWAAASWLLWRTSRRRRARR